MKKNTKQRGFRILTPIGTVLFICFEPTRLTVEMIMFIEFKILLHQVFDTFLYLVEELGVS